MSFSTSAFDSILAKGAQVKYPKPSQSGQWDSEAAFVLPPADDSYWDAKPPKQFVEDLQKLLPANVKLHDYLKGKGSTKIGDIDGTGEPPDPKMMNDLYGTVQIDGRIMAEVYNGGMCVTGDLLPAGTPDSVRSQFGLRLSLDAIGPQLAQKRLDEIATAFGAEIVHAKTAQTQNVWGEQPAWDDPTKTNKDAWMDILDGYFNQRTAGTLLEAQLFGQDDAQSETAAA